MKNRLFIFALLCAGLVGCNLNPNRGMLTTTIDGFAQGTYYHIVYMSRDTLLLQSEIDSLFQRVDRSMSIFNPSSLIVRLNNNETDTLDDYITYCIAEARKVSELSGGLYDITVTPLVEAWGFAAKEGVQNPNLDSLVKIVGYDKISVQNGRLVKADPRMKLDLNSIAKGYTADLLGELIASHGVENYLVELGGEIVAKGNNPTGQPWAVGIDKPIEGNLARGGDIQVVMSITDIGMATSGNYRNFHTDEEGNRVVHIINPKTGAAVQGNLLSATVVAPTCARADALGTALMALGVEKSIELLESDPTIQAYLIYTDETNEFKTYISPELKDKIVE